MIKKLFTLLALAFCLNGNAQIITTVAGGIFGDGGAATVAELSGPYGVAIDGAGNVYIADQSNQRIRKVNTAGIISTFAGNGHQGNLSLGGYSGDGGPATAAELGSPTGVSCDAAGNVYIADYENNRIRKVNTSGIISTIAGNGTFGYSGDGGYATAAEINGPQGVAFDAAGNMYIADKFNNRIRMVNTAGIISTYAGNGTAGYSGDGGTATTAELNYPWGVAFDAAANMYIVDERNNRIRMVNTAGIISTFAGNNIGGYSGDGGPATAAELAAPFGVAVDGTGNVYIADNFNEVIRIVNTAGIISTFAGNNIGGYSGDGGPATAAELAAPYGVAVDGTGNVYIANFSNNLIRMVNSSGTISTFAGNNNLGYSGNGGAATTAALDPAGIAFDPAGNMYVADGYNVIRKVSTAGIISTFAGNGTAGYSGDGGSATAAQLWFPKGVAFDAAGNMYIADWENVRIRMINTAGVISTFAGNGTAGYSGDGGPATAAELYEPENIAFDAAGNMYFSEYTNDVIRKVNTAGIISTFAGIHGSNSYGGDGGYATSAGLNDPYGVACDAAGNLYIADYGNSLIRKVNTNGIISTVAGSTIGIPYNYGYGGDGGPATAAYLYNPTGVTFDVSGNMYIAEAGNNLIRMVNTAGIISTIAGNGVGAGTYDSCSICYGGDGGPATAAELNKPAAIAFDAAGNMYISDGGNYRVRKVDSVVPCSPVINFTLTNVSLHTYDVVPTYSNVSSARWYWGDGTDTLALYPSHTYSVAGTYSICVTAYSACGDSVVSCQNDAVSRLANNNSVFSNMVYVNVVPSITTATASPTTICAGSTTTLTASGATTYSWSPATGLSATTGSVVAASPTVTTTYTVVGTTGASTVSTAVTVSVNPLPTLTATTSNVTCHGLSTGSATATVTGGTGPSYTVGIISPPQGGITTGIETFSGLAAGNYTIGVQDANSCQSIFPITIAQPTILNLTATTTSVTCNGLANGSATATASGGTAPYTVGIIVPPQGGITTGIIVFSGLAAGSYTIGAQDANGCEVIFPITITQPTVLMASIASVKNDSCFGNSNGSAVVGASGGTIPYTYSWNTSPVQTASTSINLAAGNYTSTVTDANSCVATTTISITQPPLLTVSSTPVTICISNVATLMATAMGGNQPYIYTIGGSPTNTVAVSPTATTTYPMQVNDVKGCIATNIVTVFVRDSLHFIAVSPNETICAGFSASLNSMGSGGDSTYTYTWYPGSFIGQFITVQPTSTIIYTVVLTDACGTPAVTSSVEVDVTNCAGIEQFVNNNEQVKIYPNPNNGSFVIEPNNATKQTMQVYDINGKLVLSQTINGKTTIDASNLNEGVYNLSIISNEGVTNKRLVIVR